MCDPPADGKNVMVYMIITLSRILDASYLPPQFAEMCQHMHETEK